MSDDRTKRGPQDANRVNVNEDYEVRYWCERFECTPEELRNAVKEVGPMVADVSTKFARRQQSAKR